MDFKAFLRVLALVPVLFVAGEAGAQSTEQVLDTIAVFGQQQAGTIDWGTPPTYTKLPAFPIASSLRACKLTSNSGLFCLDSDKYVWNWSNPASSAPGQKLFNCTQISELDPKSSETCTGITVDPEGNIWLAGKNKGRTHSLVKVKDGSCPTGAPTFSGRDRKGDAATYCSITWASGRPLLLDIELISGEAADAFYLGDGLDSRKLGEGIIGVQERKTVVFFPAEIGSDTPPPSDQIADLGSGKTGWNLAGNEQLQGATLLQPPENPDDFVLVTTSTGRVLAKNTRTADVATWLPSSGLCNPRSPQQFGIRASAKSGLVYISDRECKTVIALRPDETTGEPSPFGTLALGFSPEGPTLAAGIGVNLLSAACKSADGCEVTPGATLFSSNTGLSGGSGLTLFQIKGIPDCRWDPAADALACKDKKVIGVTVTDGSCNRDAVTHKLPADCLTESVKIRTPVAGESDLVRGKQYLNVTPLLPAEITDLYPNGLPAILVSPQYRARSDDRTFEAFFGVPEEGVVFTGTIGGEYELAELLSGRAGTDCYDPMPNDTYVELLNWDVATRVSEKYGDVDGLFVDTLINNGCGSVTTIKGGWSMVSYGLEIMPHPVVLNNDAVFARLVERLGGELQYVVNELACKPADGLVAPIADCTALKSALGNTADKLGKCIEATYQPKQSASNQNCQSFVQQFEAFKTTLAATTSACPSDPGSCDPANRIGEVKARTNTLEYVYYNKFVPSVPAGGFCKEAGTTPCPR